MFGSVFTQIQALRGNRKINIDRHNHNRYRLYVEEENGFHTSYYFSTPIYNIHSGRLVKRAFTQCGSLLRAEGSNAEITVDGASIILKNGDGAARLFVSRRAAILPTLNGIAVKIESGGIHDFMLSIHTDRAFSQIKSNTKYFAVMIENFRPFLLASAIGVWDEAGAYAGPAKLISHTIDDRNFTITLLTENRLSGTYMLEINLYEPKIFEDTTVESKNPHENNLYGGMGWIGESTPFGLQWLYSKINAGRIPEITERNIKRAVMHIPKYSRGDLELKEYGLTARFCSVGSTWENKTEAAGLVSQAAGCGRYYSFDLTNHIRDPRTGIFTNMNGLVLRPAVKGGGFAAIATGDNYFTPQILEVCSA